jgi:ATP-dependent DNA helicase RecG
VDLPNNQVELWSKHVKCNQNGTKCNSIELHLRSVNESVNNLVDSLRVTGSDFTSVEAKSAAGGFPVSITESLSALANLPGGGVIILGLDEEAGFTPVDLVNVTGMKAALGQKVRNFTPPVRLDIDDGEVDGKPVIVARVQECDAAHKPCRAPDGKAYVRSWDGDYAASELEEQAFLMQRTHPRVDSIPVPTGTADELDPELIALWREGVDGDDPSGLGRFEGDEQLRRGGILTADGQPTLGGLLALGIQPQQFLPSVALQLSNSSPTGGRARNPAVLTGPLPVILDQPLEWARQNFTRDVVKVPTTVTSTRDTRGWG